MKTNSTDEFNALIAELERQSGQRIHNTSLIRRAMTHSSTEAAPGENNERLEFLGDSVLNLAITTLLYEALPTEREGDLTERRSCIVSRRVAARVARRLGLGRWLTIGKSLDRHLGLPGSLLGNALEALLGAVYLQTGFRATHRLIAALYGPEIEVNLREGIERNEKMLLQEWVQKAALPLPRYLLLGHGGPPFARSFHMQVEIAGRLFPTAWGRTKRQAERLAAREALRLLSRSEGLPASSVDSGAPQD